MNPSGGLKRHVSSWVANSSVTVAEWHLGSSTLTVKSSPMIACDSVGHSRCRSCGNCGVCIEVMRCTRAASSIKTSERNECQTKYARWSPRHGLMLALSHRGVLVQATVMHKTCAQNGHTLGPPAGYVQVHAKPPHQAAINRLKRGINSNARPPSQSRPRAEKPPSPAGDPPQTWSGAAGSRTFPRQR
jgi:hypothetical protein